MHKFLFFFIALFITGCSNTNQLIRETKGTTYKEKVSSILITEDKKKIVFISPKYHYVFDAPESIGKVIESPIHENVSAVFREFKMDGNNITGWMALLLSTYKLEDPSGVLLQAKEIGFHSSEYTDWVSLQPNQLRLKEKLRGNRYNASALPGANLKKQQLKHDYTVRVMDNPTTSHQLKLITLSPLTVTADGVVLIGTLPLTLLGWGALGISCEMSKNGCR